MVNLLDYKMISICLTVSDRNHTHNKYIYIYIYIYIYTHTHLFPSFGFKSLFGIRLKKEWKGEISKKFIHHDTGIECHLSTRQEKQMVWSLHKKEKKRNLG